MRIIVSAGAAAAAIGAVGLSGTGVASAAPDVEGMTYEEAERHYWDYLVRLLHWQRVTTDAATLRDLPMDVELSERVRDRLPG